MAGRYQETKKSNEMKAFNVLSEMNQERLFLKKKHLLTVFKTYFIFPLRQNPRYERFFSKIEVKSCQSLKNCLLCGKEFTTRKHKQKYCSRECYWEDKTQNPVVKRVCPICGKEFELAYSAYCSRDCAYKSPEIFSLKLLWLIVSN